jgi:hypothetical protein
MLKAGLAYKPVMLTLPSPCSALSWIAPIGFFPISAGTKLPVAPNPSGVYIMFEGTPYAHLMVYQDPRKMK